MLSQSCMYLCGLLKCLHKHTCIGVNFRYVIRGRVRVILCVTQPRLYLPLQRQQQRLQRQLVPQQQQLLLRNPRRQALQPQQQQLRELACARPMRVARRSRHQAAAAVTVVLQQTTNALWLLERIIYVLTYKIDVKKGSNNFRIKINYTAFISENINRIVIT